MKLVVFIIIFTLTIVMANNENEKIVKMINKEREPYNLLEVEYNDLLQRKMDEDANFNGTNFDEQFPLYVKTGYKTLFDVRKDRHKAFKRIKNSKKYLDLRRCDNFYFNNFTTCLKKNSKYRGRILYPYLLQPSFTRIACTDKEQRSYCVARRTDIDADNPLVHRFPCT